MNAQNLKIITLNVNCLGKPASRAGLVDFMDRFSPDLLCIQECNIPSEDLQGLVTRHDYKALVNLDTADENARGTAFVWKNVLDFKNFTVVEANRLSYIMLGDLMIINIYAHSGRVARAQREELFSRSLNDLLQSSSHLNKILLGDFNSIISRRDAMHNPGQKISQSLLQIVRIYNMADAFREVNQTAGYTLIRNNGASRIDRIYVPNKFRISIITTEVLPAPFTDHAAVGMILAVTGISRRETEQSPATYWKLNVSILDDEDFLPNFSELYDEIKDGKEDYADLGEWWECQAKPVIRIFCEEIQLNASKR